MDEINPHEMSSKNASSDESRLFPEGFFNISRRINSSQHKDEDKKDPNGPHLHPKPIKSFEEKAYFFYLRWWGKLPRDRKIELILAFAIVIFAAAQWITSNINNDSTAHQTDQLIGTAKMSVLAAEQNAGAASSFSDSAQRINSSINNATAKLQMQVDNMYESQISSEQESARSLQATIDNFHQEQRAWVGVQGTSDSKGFTEKDTWQIVIVFFNSGRTPAKNVQTSVEYITSPVPISGPSPQQIRLLTFRPAQSIAPQGFYRQSIGRASGAENTSADQLAGKQVLVSQYHAIKSKQLFLYYFGILKYDDTVGHSHETQFCIYLSDPDTKETGICDSFNDLN
jgi:hypothetical protein